ncbi:MAG TPA: hypothetical protein PLL75_04980 [Candidatus Omnitrophota bacterium]|nr:hypothetical protein [Candidatus Omnitrophota bacterium]HPS37063.1 hypothetical protein [Candidatus Omnitrophota bacterium]
MNKRTVFVMLLGLFTGAHVLAAGENAYPPPQISLNGKPGNVTVQDLSGLGTRPLRLLVKRNNKARGYEFFRVYALGVREGDSLAAQWKTRLPGTRVTVYRIFREAEGGARFLSMPQSVYFQDAKPGEYFQQIKSAQDEYLIFVFEKTDSSDEKNIQIRYFEERVRKLVIASYKTNFLLSSLKLKMKDFGGGESEKFFERDAQLLIDRMTRPQEIILVRLWKIRA